jgi:hypothetical protein
VPLEDCDELKNAIDIASAYLKPLGTCSALTTQWKENRGVDYEEEEEEDEEDEEDKGIKLTLLPCSNC